MFVIGYVPAPYTYGLVNELFPDIDPVTNINLSRNGMKAVLWSSLLGGICLALAVILKRRSLRKAKERLVHSIAKKEKIQEERALELFIEDEKEIEKSYHNLDRSV